MTILPQVLQKMANLLIRKVLKNLVKAFKICQLKWPPINSKFHKNLIYLYTQIVSKAQTIQRRKLVLLKKSLFLQSRELFLKGLIIFLICFFSKIGYGHIVPLTMNGKIFCIFYASCGIPFTLVFLSACVQRLQEPTFKMLAWMMSGRMGRVLTPLGTVLYKSGQ